MKQKLKNLAWLLMAVIMSTGLMAQNYSGGSGTSGDPYQISNKADLKYLSDNSGEWTKHFIQTANIAFVPGDFESAGDFYYGGAGFLPIGGDPNSGSSFTGTYKGNSHTIDGLTINRSTTNFIGMFSAIVGGAVNNLGLTNVNITGKSYVGGLAGAIFNTVIDNCYTSGSVSGTEMAAGGLIGYMLGTNTVSNSMSSCAITGGNGAFYAGFIGHLVAGTVSSCYCTGNIISNGDEGNGGFVAFNQGGTINNCYCTGNVKANIGVGGFAGGNSSSISNCYCTGNVEGNGDAGGFSGSNNNEGSISNCYSLGDVSRLSGTDTQFGGFCAKIEDGTIEYCYSTGDVTIGVGTDKGFVGTEEGTNTYTGNFWDSEASNQSTATGATAKDTDEMHTLSTFTGAGAGWDFFGETTNGTDDDWDIDDGNDYPYLSWQEKTMTWTGSTSSAWDDADNWTGSEAAPLNSKNVTITNTGNAPIVGASMGASCNNLTVNSNAVLTVNSGGSLITNGSISNDGTINIERSISDNQWHLISAPVVGATAETFAGNYMQSYSETTALWTDLSSSGDELSPATGYSLWVSAPPKESFTFSGTPLSGNQSVGFTAVNAHGWNLLGNPYPSYLDWDLVIAGQSNMNGGVYCYNGSTYVSYNNGLGGGERYIAPMQGFFVSTTAAGTFSLTNDYRTHTTGTYFKEKEKPTNYLCLAATGNDITDELHLRFNNDASADFDGQYDAWKLMTWNDEAPQLYSFSGDEILSIDQRPECETLQLGFANITAGIYQISVKEIADIPNAFLEDSKTGIFHDLTKGAYEFAWDVSDNEKRFKLHLNAVGIEENQISESNLLIYAADGNIYIHAGQHAALHGGTQNTYGTTQHAVLAITDMTGRIVMQQEISGTGIISIPVNLLTGVYVVIARNGEEVRTEKVFMKINS